MPKENISNNNNVSTTETITTETITTDTPTIDKDKLNKLLDVKTGTATIGKFPGGDLRDVEVTQGMTIGEVFKKEKIGVANSEIQKNYKTAKLTDTIQPGDTVLAVTKIRGND
ncbi:MAG: hypothetical protein HYW78_02495 [Parcubacteria group bacterium]|nr:hypothetical protein [Parcubacteria group bacterium]